MTIRSRDRLYIEMTELEVGNGSARKKRLSALKADESIHTEGSGDEIVRLFYGCCSLILYFMIIRVSKRASNKGNCFGLIREATPEKFLFPVNWG